MLTERQIQDISGRIVGVAGASIRKIILFGSYARGDAKEDSDLDIMVVKREVKDYISEYGAIRTGMAICGTGVDLVLYDEEMFNNKKNMEF